MAIAQTAFAHCPAPMLIRSTLVSPLLQAQQFRHHVRASQILDDQLKYHA